MLIVLFGLRRDFEFENEWPHYGTFVSSLELELANKGRPTNTDRNIIRANMLFDFTNRIAISDVGWTAFKTVLNFGIVLNNLARETVIRERNFWLWWHQMVFCQIAPAWLEETNPRKKTTMPEYWVPQVDRYVGYLSCLARTQICWNNS